MRSVIRFGGATLAALCLLLSVGSLALWPRTRTRSPAMWLRDYDHPGSSGQAITWGLAVVRGQVRLARESEAKVPEHLQFRLGQLDLLPPFAGTRGLTLLATPQGRLGFDAQHAMKLTIAGPIPWVSPWSTPVDVRLLAWPIWFQALLLAVPPLIWWRTVAHNRRQAVRARTGCCLACGYDLRATPQRCPECGRMVQPGDGIPPRVWRGVGAAFLAAVVLGGLLAAALDAAGSQYVARRQAQLNRYNIAIKDSTDPRLTAAQLRRLLDGLVIDPADAGPRMLASAKGGHAELALVWLEHGAPEALPDANGGTALHACAARAGFADQTALAEALLRRGLSVNARDHAGRTPLHYLRCAGELPADERAIIAFARWLLDHGADVGARDHDGKTPLDLQAADTPGELLRLLAQDVGSHSTGNARGTAMP
jgi:hypothetical protein